MELDVHDDMSPLFTFHVDDFHAPPQPSPSTSDRLPTIEEHTPSRQTPNKQHQHLHQQPQQHNQHPIYTLIKHPDGQISLKFLNQPQSQSQLLSILNSQNQSQIHSITHSQPKSQNNLNKQNEMELESKNFEFAKSKSYFKQMDMVYPVIVALTFGIYLIISMYGDGISSYNGLRNFSGRWNQSLIYIWLVNMEINYYLVIFSIFFLCFVYFVISLLLIK